MDSITEAIDWIDLHLGPAATTTVEIGAGVGLLGRVIRLQRTAAEPASVILKLPSTNPGNRTIAEMFGYYRREAGFYRALRPRRALPVPACFAVLGEPDAPMLLLEDRTGPAEADQLAGATVAQMEATVDAIAAVHAAFWNDRSLMDHAWLPGPLDEVISGYGRHFAACWPEAARRLEVGPRESAAAAAAMARFDAVCRRFSSAPTTLIHGDLRLDNVLFDADGRAVLIDWQLTARGRGPYDLAFFLSGSVEPGLRHAHERRLVTRYAERLARLGVAGYTVGRAWTDYRLGLVMNLPNPVTALVAVDPATERGRHLLEANLRRALQAVSTHWLDPDPELTSAA